MKLPLYIIALLVAYANGFNLDPHNAKNFQDPNRAFSSPSSYFGFSVALYAKGAKSELLVGAPRANTTRAADRRDGFLETGAIYRCLLGSTKQCEEYLIDDTNNNNLINLYPSVVRQNKDYAWLGATLLLEDAAEPRILACAPRWKQQVYSQQSKMNGMCYSGIYRTSPIRRYFPLLSYNDQIIQYDNKGRYFYGMAQTGFSAHLFSNNSRFEFMLGAPGVLDWKGTTLIPKKSSTHDAYDAFVQNTKGNSFPNDYDDYFGYSLTLGKFFSRNSTLVASSAPRSGYTLGKVFIYRASYRDDTSSITPSLRLTVQGEQYGEYFGSSLASCDINKDGRDDLIVGAPTWSKDADEGRIYAFTFTAESNEFSKGNIARKQHIDGETPGGRFGTSLVCLGDLHRNGYTAIAVGAPYEGSGAIYVYSSSAKGLDSRASQKILASDISRSLIGFGISIAEPRDVDGDGYVDVAVGAHRSSHAVLIKSKPVVNLSVKIAMLQSGDTVITENTTNFMVAVCARYSGNYAPQMLKVKETLKIDGFHKRAVVYQHGRLFGNSFEVSTTLKRGEEQCNPVKITLKKNIQNVIDPIEMESFIFNSEDPLHPDSPIVDPYNSILNDSMKVQYVLDCGDDDLCISNLHVNMTTSLISGNRYTIGSKSNVNLSIFVENTMEPAYRAQAHIYIPEPIRLARIPPECDEQSLANKILEILCNVGNPLRTNSTIVMELDMSAINYDEIFKELRVSVTTQSTENDDTDDFALLNIDFDIDADIAIIGKSDEDLYWYFDKEFKEKNLKQFTFNHIYEIRKFGLTPINETVVLVNVPTHWKQSEIARVNDIQASLDGQQYSCEITTGQEANSSLIALDEKYLYEQNNSIIVPPIEQTFYLNCTDYDVICQRFRCKLGPFIKAQSVAKLTISIDFQLNNVSEDALQGKDIFYVSEGFVAITQPNITIDSVNKRPDFKQIGTMFLNRREPEEVALWIIIVSVLLGIVLLILLTLLLFKLGFFDRQRKDMRPKEEAETNIVDDTNDSTTDGD